MHLFAPENYSIEFYDKNIIINAASRILTINHDSFVLHETLNSKLRIAVENKKEYISGDFNNTPEAPLYLSSRNIYKNNHPGCKSFFDIVVYNNQPVLPQGTLTRSIGHYNDVSEIEIHQVLSGTVLSLFINNNSIYYGIFSDGDYFQIPAGWYHCSYILYGPAVVANFYKNAFWMEDISQKPYNACCNIYSIEKDAESFIIKNCTGSICDDLSHINRHFSDYKMLNNCNFFNTIDYKSVFDLYESTQLVGA